MSVLEIFLECENFSDLENRNLFENVEHYPQVSILVSIMDDRDYATNSDSSDSDEEFYDAESITSEHSTHSGTSSVSYDNVP